MKPRKGYVVTAHAAAAMPRGRGGPPKFSCSALVALVALAGCAQSRPDSLQPPVGAEIGSTLRATASEAPQPLNADARSASHCADGESLLISCRIAGSADIASICALTDGQGSGGAYFAYGPLTRPEIVALGEASQPHVRPMHSEHRWFAGNTFGHSYSFPHAGGTRVFYSISYMRREPGDHGVMVIPQGASEAIEVSRCDTESVVEADPALRERLTEGWGEDESIAGDRLPAWDPT